MVSTRMEASKDGRFLCAVGTYKPRVRCYEVEQLGLKFERFFQKALTDFILRASFLRNSPFFFFLFLFFLIYLPRCFDSEVVAFEMLSDDYSKMVFLHCDR